MKKIYKYFKNYGKVIFNGLIIVILVIVLLFFVIKNNHESESFVIESNSENEGDINAEKNNSEKKEKEEEKVEKIKVHVVGFVKSPGLIELDEGSRINDAIEKAGGITEEGDLSKVNLAYILNDGEKIYIPSLSDENNGDGINSEEMKSGKVNINNANEEELKKITGIGASIAKKIIEYRVANGKFSSIEEIKNVSRNRR